MYTYLDGQAGKDVTLLDGEDNFYEDLFVPPLDIIKNIFIISEVIYGKRGDSL